MKVVCLDAFNPSYLEYAPYLKSLTEKYQHGELEIPLGFWGANEVFFKGKSDTLAFFYHSLESSLKWTKNFYWLGRLPLTCLINFQRLLKDQRQFFSLANIPLKKLHLFDTAIKRKLEQDSNISFKIFHQLDVAGHKYGTRSTQIKDAMQELDGILEKMDFDVIMSDHSMMDIKETISVPQTKTCFIDSTMARYWYDKPKNLPLKKGKIIKADKKFGHTIFLANPGVLITPNFWQGDKLVKAMHGYDPKHKNMKTFYLIKKPGKKRNLKMIDLHNLIKNENFTNTTKL